MRRIRVLLTCITVLLVGCHRSRPTDAGVTHIIKASDEMVAELLQAPMTVPDAVLNRARCVIAIPAMGAQINWGVATCRDNREQWQTPAAVRFIAAKPQPEDVFIVLMNERIANRLNSGALRVGSDGTDRAGPLLQQIATVTDADLSADILSYTRKGGVLQGARISGQVTLQRQQTIDVDPAQHFVRTMTSFSNTIYPIGLIIHHSAVIPGDDKVPEKATDVEAFHQERGFDIVCGGRDYHVAYHYLILANGNVKAGRPERCQGAHARSYNAYLGIVLFGDFSSADNPRGDKGQTQPSDAQLRALVQLCRQLMTRYQIPLQRVLRHSDVASTHCPGDRFPFAALLRMLQARG